MSLWRYGWWLDNHPTALFAASTGASLVAGKYYFEVTVVSSGNGSDTGWGVAVGIGSATMTSLFDIVEANVNLPQAASVQSNFITIKSDGGTNEPGWGYPDRPTGCSATAQGAVVGVAVNTIAKTLYWRNATTGSVWNLDGTSDPATGAGTTNLWSAAGLSPVTGNIYIIAGADLGNSGGFGSPLTEKGKGTLNFGATAFTGTAPSGYVSIESVFPGASLDPNNNSDLTLTNGNLTFEGFSDNTALNGPFCACRSRFTIAV